MFPEITESMDFQMKSTMFTIAKYRAMQEQGVPIEDADMGLGGYDLAMIDGKLMRVQAGFFLEPLLRAPLPPEFWALAVYRPVIVPTRLAVFAAFVDNLKELSKCEDKHTAAIITDSDMSQVYSIGINGGPRGSQYQCLCDMGSKYTCIHAEANAIAKCTSADKDKVMICSYSPCVTCASLIVNSGFSKVYYLCKYKDDTGLDILMEAGIGVEQIQL